MIETPASESKQVLVWQNRIKPTLQILLKMAGSTEDQFLALGSRLQEFAFRSADTAREAHDLVELVSGRETSELNEQLKTLFSEMENYLDQVRKQGQESCKTLEQVLTLLDNVMTPLEGFQKMDKALRMLSISTKIESSRIGELGAGFITLAMDVEKLSHTVNEKSASIMKQRNELTKMIEQNLQLVRTAGKKQQDDAGQILAQISGNTETILDLNRSSSEAGAVAAQTANEVAADIGNVVASMQFHDITRQQVEHVIEALEKLFASMAQNNNPTQLVSETGDVCELQSAQLHHASEQFNQAVEAIIENLNSIAAKQGLISNTLQNALTGGGSSGGNSLFEKMQQGMKQVTAILRRCAETDQELSATMASVASTINEISNFVSDIEAVGSEIDLIALNAQIKAAHTGTEGAALGVLAEAIKRLSLDAVTQTKAVAETLLAINDVTRHLFDTSATETCNLSSQVEKLDYDAGSIVLSFEKINNQIEKQFTALCHNATSLSEEIAAATASVHVHTEVRNLINEPKLVLEQIYHEARTLIPATEEFRSNLRHMEERYTMESERMIHEMLAARHGIKLNLQSQAAASSSDSEFGDNVDLF
jgi:methyl-accepting chemotaxis protein